MKSLEILREEGSDRAKVECASGTVSVHVKCAFCKHCKGIKVGARVMPSPYIQISSQVKSGIIPPEAMMEAGMQFNTLVRDGTEVACDDDENKGFSPR